VTTAHAPWRRDIGWAAGGNALYAVAQALQLIALARIGSAADVGTYSLALSISAPVFMLGSLRLSMMMASDSRGAYADSDYLRLRAMTTVLGIAVIAAIAAVGPYRGAIALVLLLLGVAKAAESGSDLAYGALTRAGEFRAVAVSLASRGLLTTLTTAVTFKLTGSVIAVAAAQAILWTLYLFGIDIARARQAIARSMVVGSRVVTHRSPIVDLFLTALPLGFVSVALSVAATIPRIALNAVGGTAMVGQFTVLAYGIVAGRTVALALSQAAMPRLGRAVADGNRAVFVHSIWTLLKIGVVWGVLGVVATAGLGRPALQFIFGAEYAALAPELTLVMIAAGLSYLSTFLQDATAALREFRALAVLVSLSTGTLLLATIILTPTGGIRGAVQALLLAGIVELCGSALITAYFVTRTFRSD